MQNLQTSIAKKIRGVRIPSDIVLQNLYIVNENLADYCATLRFEADFFTEPTDASGCLGTSPS